MKLTLEDLHNIKELVQTIVQETVNGSESRLRKEMGSMKSELRAEIKSMKTELKQEMDFMKTELRQEMKEMKIQIEEKLEDSERNIIQTFGEIMSGYERRLCALERRQAS